MHEYDGTLFEQAGADRHGASLATHVTLLAPCQPSKVVALWNNYHALSAEARQGVAAHPLFLMKPAISVIGPGEPIRRPTSYRGQDRL